MGCGSCGQRYRQDSLYTFVGNSRGNSRGVIKKVELQRREVEAQSKLAALEKKKSTPVTGQSGPENEPN